MRCTNHGVTCAGYRQKLSRNSQSKALRPLRPCTSLQQPGLQSPIGSFEDSQYFHLFIHEKTSRYDGVYQSNVWRRLIPQISQREPFVMDAVVALGAISQHSDRLKNNSDCGSSKSDFDELARHEMYALIRYDRALRSMRQALKRSDDNIRLALIACLLVFCFETNLGNQQSAITHAVSGVKLLRDWQSSHSTSLSPADRSPVPRYVEDELVQSFARLDLQVSILLDVRPAGFHQVIVAASATALRNMPSKFKDVSEARLWAVQVMRLQCHLRSRCLGV